jgi:hypothetical protein
MSDIKPTDIVIPMSPIDDELNNADYLAKTRICARLMNKDIKAANFIHTQYEEIQRIQSIIKENEADAKRYRFIRAGFTRSNKLVVAIDSDIPRGIKRYLDIHLDENVDEAMRVKGE